MCYVAILIVVTKGLSVSRRFLPFEYYRDASSALLQFVNQMIKFYLLTFSPFFPYYGRQIIKVLR